MLKSPPTPHSFEDFNRGMESPKGHLIVMVRNYCYQWVQNSSLPRDLRY